MRFHRVIDGVTVSNGLAWSPDRRTMYHADTPAHSARIRPLTRQADAVEPAHVRTLGARDRPPGQRRGRQRGLLLGRAPPGQQGRRDRSVRTHRTRDSVPAMCPTMCAFSGPDLTTLYAMSARPSRAADEAPEHVSAIGRRVRNARRRPRPPGAALRRLTPMTDPTAFLRLDALNSLGSTATGASFAVDRRRARGVVLEPGVFRLRAGPNTRPDCGIVTGRVKPCEIAQPSPDTWTFASGDSTPARLAGIAARVPAVVEGPTGDRVDHRPAFPWRRGLPAFGRVRASPHWIASLALASGRPVYGLGEQFGSLDKRGRLVHSQVADCLGVNTGCSLRTRRSPWSRGPAAARGAVRQHARARHARRRPPRLVAPQLRGRRRRRGARPVPVRGGRASGSSTCTQLTGRAPRCRAGASACGSRMYYRRPAKPPRRPRSSAAARFLRRHRTRRAHHLEDRHALRLPVGCRALPRPAGGDRGDPGASPARVRLGVPVRLGPRSALPSSRSAPCSRRTGRPLRVRWDTDPATSLYGDAPDAAAGLGHRRLHQPAAPARGGATRTRPDRRWRRRVRGPGSAGRCPSTRSPSTAITAHACTTSTRSCSTGASTTPPRASSRRRPGRR
ncbi:MAG: SMP-30/gluconolactonase/LRE family protein [Betaproteobacteria bacterium]|nr:SMP-30/gluconolactonase/LRE family protein [Betaproteobacteria bacterium]